MRIGRTRSVVITGTVPLGTTSMAAIDMENPSRFARTLLAEMLAATGVVVEGGLFGPDVTAQATPADAETIAEHVSDLNTALNFALNGAYFSTGQRCTASSRLIVTDAIHDRFVAGLKERLASLVVGDALNAGTNIGPVVDQSQLDQDLRYISMGREEGAHLAFGSQRLQCEHEGFYLQPALFTQATHDMRI